MCRCREDVNKVLWLGAFIDLLEVSGRCEIHAHQPCAGELLGGATATFPEVYLSSFRRDEKDKCRAETLQRKVDLVKSQVTEVTATTQHELFRCWVRPAPSDCNASKSVEKVRRLVALAKNEQLCLVLLRMITCEQLRIFDVRFSDTIACPEVDNGVLYALRITINVCADIHRVLKEYMLLMRRDREHLAIACDLMDLLSLSSYLASGANVKRWRVQHVHSVDSFW